MRADRWRRIREAFDQVVAADPGQRERILARLRSEDAEVASEVEELLEADAEAGDFLETPASVPPGLLGRSGRGASPGDRVGPYRILGELGRGGMGEVYRAERADGEYRQRVAVKLLRPGPGSGELAARFQAERQILASLDHPGIARLLDGGTASDGRAYLVMEHVEGEPLLAWCDERRLTVERRLALFVEVCRAVGYAHRNLLVHRDLKAANILVTEEGRPKLLDFGIAKLLEGSELPGRAPPTTTGRRLMTPQCASPEQVRGEAITTASDVYQLGLLLYELLAGVPPYRIESRSPAEVERIVCETRPEPPSERVGEPRGDAPPPGDPPGPRAGDAGAGPDGLREDPDPGEGGAPREERGRRDGALPEEIARRRSTRPDRLRARLAGDLDTIVSMALRKEPERRYASADRLADDLERFLDGRPVSARGDSLRYRVGRFVGRNRGAVAAAGGLVLLLVALAVLSVRYAVTTAEQARQIAAERDRARTEAARAEQVTEFMVSLFEGALPGSERQDTVSVRTILDRAGDRIDTALTGQPEVRGALLDAVGRIQYRLGAVDQGLARVRQALRLRRRLHDGPDPDVVESLHHLADLHGTSFHYRRADTLYRAALALLDELPGPDSSWRAELLQGRSDNVRNLGRADTAVALAREAVALRRAVHGEGHPAYLNALRSLAFALRGAGELEEAEELYGEVVAGLRALGDRGRTFLPRTLHDLAYIHDQKGEDRAAEPLYREASRLHRRLYGDGHPRSLRYMGDHAASLSETGRTGEAESVARWILRATTEHHGDSTWQAGTGHGRLGGLLFRHGKYAEAADAFRRMMAHYVADLGRDHLWTAVAEHNLGSALLLAGRSAEGRRHLERSYPSLEEGGRRVTTLLSMDNLEVLVEHLRSRGEGALASRYQAILDLAV